MNSHVLRSGTRAIGSSLKFVPASEAVFIVFNVIFSPTSSA